MKMTVSTALEAISATVTVMNRHQYEYTRQRIMRDNLICDAMAGKVATRELQRRTNLSRQQLHKISDRGPQPLPPEWSDS